MIVEQKKNAENTKKVNFKTGNHVVYPSHGVGKILEIKEDIILDRKLKTIVVFFEKDNMKLTIPYQKSSKVNLRHLISIDDMEEIFTILQSGTKKQKGMWSRRAQEYENKVNSVYMLEKNIKESKGCLRDLNTMFWILKYRYRVSNILEIKTFDQSLLVEIRKLYKALDFLIMLRLFSLDT